MARQFENIRVGWQLEMPASHGAIIHTLDKDFDPDRVAEVAIVTHIFHDPVEAKDYICLAAIQGDGTYGKPRDKRTVTGLARCGWRKAERDWIEFATQISDEKSNVIGIFK
ncbi:MAG: hypothetical protein JKY45_02510 [Emcibacter sp.]|nr:hypothetical protein [Emcibacter sp.]